ncbi:homeobox protein notochord [Heterocephalus glaber]|uniref:Homeobox protein notochord n=1 Tax=Heterocephalus glaber TaxID=10181 RepID=A0AAX6TDT7_HETGA|nr:homeobox protein notochord [Heterocephalus glaber]
MPSPRPRDSELPVPQGAGPASPAPLRLESSFSVDAILARPGPRARVTSLPPVFACALAPGLWSAPWRFPCPALPWACAASWAPALLSVGAHARLQQHAVPRLHAAPFGGLAGVGVTGWELPHCSGLWAPPHWAPPEDLQDTERHQKRVRTMFNLEQLEELEKVFAKQHNLVGKKRAQLAARLHLTENQVRIWFQNRRVKYQKQQKLKLPALSAVAASPDEPSSSSDSSIQSEDAQTGADI